MEEVPQLLQPLLLQPVGAVRHLQPQRRRRRRKRLNLRRMRSAYANLGLRLLLCMCMSVLLNVCAYFMINHVIS